RAVRPRGRARRDRLPGPVVNTVVLGSGTWGTCFSRLLADRGHDVTLASNHEEDARAIAAAGRNPRYATSVDLAGIAATTSCAAPGETSGLVVVAIPSHAFRSVVEGLPGRAPVLSLTKGLDPETGERLSTLVRGRPVAVLSGPNMAEEVVAGLP